MSRPSLGAGAIGALPPHHRTAVRIDSVAFETTHVPIHPSVSTKLDAGEIQMVASGLALKTATFNGGDIVD